MTCVLCYDSLQTFVLDATAGDQAHQVKVFNCLGNWTGYEILSQDQLLQSKLVPALFVALVFAKSLT